MAKQKENPKFSVILDTSFMIRLLNEADRLHPNVRGYFRYFLENGIPMYFFDHLHRGILCERRFL